jgi:hypothetical protein
MGCHRTAAFPNWWSNHSGTMKAKTQNKQPPEGSTPSIHLERSLVMICIASIVLEHPGESDFGMKHVRWPCAHAVTCVKDTNPCTKNKDCCSGICDVTGYKSVCLPGALRLGVH